MIYVQVTEVLSVEEEAIPLTAVEQAAREALIEVQMREEADLSIVFTDEEHMRQLNLQFRQVDASTDVLAFSDGTLDPETGRVYLGDVIISYPRAVEQAKNAGHSVEAELQLLTVHGVLHLCGLDHRSRSAKQSMWAHMRGALDRLGFEGHLPP